MFNPNHTGPDAPAREGTGNAAAGNEDAKASTVAGDSPTHGTVEGSLAAQASPGDQPVAPESEGRPTEDDPRKSDGVAVFKELEARKD